MKGIVTFFINIHPSEGQDVSATIEIFKLANKELLEKVNKDSDYAVAIVPSMKEACRVEKVDFDKPFPRAISLSQREIESIEKRKEERSVERALTLKEREIEVKKLEKMYRSEEKDR